MQGSIPLRLNQFSQGKVFILNHNEGRAPLEDVSMADAIVRSQVTERAGRLPNMNTYAQTLDGDLASGDTVTFTGYTVDPDGTQDAISISVTYATSHAATSAAIEAALEAAATDLAVTRTNSNRTFTLVTSNDKRLVVTAAFDVTHAAAGTAEFGTATKSTTDTIRGFAEKTSVPRELSLSNPNAEPKYTKAQNQMMPVLYDGALPVRVNGAPADGDPVYVLLEDYTDSGSAVNYRGTCRPNTDSGAAPVVLVSNAIFTSSKDNGLAMVAIKQA